MPTPAARPRIPAPFRRPTDPQRLKSCKSMYRGQGQSSLHSAHRLQALAAAVLEALRLCLPFIPRRGSSLLAAPGRDVSCLRQKAFSDALYLFYSSLWDTGCSNTRFYLQDLNLPLQSRRLTECSLNHSHDRLCTSIFFFEDLDILETIR